jgi:hypothetical protein
MQTKSTTNITAGTSGMLDVSNTVRTSGQVNTRSAEALS